jgi:transposase
MKILALDLGKFNTTCCFFDTKTRKPQFFTTPTQREQLATVFKNNKADLVVMEACGPSGWINDLARSMKRPTLVCSTNEEAWKWGNVKRKTDKDDALKLARMAAMRELNPVHMPSQQHREFRSLVKYRKTLDQRINKTKNTIRAWFVNQGITIDTGDKAWHTGRERIDSFRKPLADCGPHELWQGELDIELTILDSLTQQIDVVVKKLEVIGKTDPRIIRLQTIPGVGPRTAEILVACIDDPHRFENGRQVSAYFGLVPKKHQSGETDRDGRITKRGNPLARTILVECAWASLRYNPWAKGVYDRIYGKQKTRKKKAGIALARKIAVIAWAMLRDEQDWDPKRIISVTESYGRMPSALKDTLQNMKPKENSDQRKSRLRREAGATKVAAQGHTSKTAGENAAKSRATSDRSTRTATVKNKSTNPTAKRNSQAASKARANSPLRKPAPKSQRARELVSGP